MRRDTSISELLGKTLSRVDYDGGENIVFTTIEGRKYRMYHYQSCCESVYVESIVGDLEDLVGTPITLAEESTSDTNPEGVDMDNDGSWCSYTWTFYKLATLKGYVDIRWYGESNGYYSESVDFEEYD